MEEKTEKEVKFDIKTVSLNEMVDTEEKDNIIIPIKGKLVLEGKLKYHKNFIRNLKIIKIQSWKKRRGEKNGRIKIH